MSSVDSASGRLGTFAALVLASMMLTACDETGGTGMSASERASHPLSPVMLASMGEQGMSPGSPILIRAYKKEAELEVWKMASDGRYLMLKSFPMCRWSGQLGPKLREGDRQIPEGFYTFTPNQMNPHSAYYLSFNVGYPNSYDRAWNRTGGSIMVHGACSSAGCFSMTDSQIDQIYALAREAFNGGQQEIQLQSFPFHLTAENMARYRDDPNIGFWRQLKEGADSFEITKQEVAVGVCGRRYVFNVSAPSGMDPVATCPGLQFDAVHGEVVAREAEDDVRVRKLVATGTPAIRTVYADGGQNPAFANADLADVSRPEALAAGPTDSVIAPKAIARSVSSARVDAGARKAKVTVEATRTAGASSIGRPSTAADRGMAN